MPVTINGTTGIVSPNFIGNGSVPVGSVYHFATSTTPTGFLFCNGNTVPNGTGTVQGVTADFSALFAILGTTYGAAGTLPDLEGVFIRGTGSQTISGITYSGTLGTKQGDDTKPHTHPISGGNATGTFLSDVSPVTANNTTTTGSGARVTTLGFGEKSFASVSYSSPTILNSTGTETRPANIALLPCIKY